MTGYVRLYKPELKMREYEHYRGVYCSLCKQLGKRYGFTLRMALSYDMTFFAVLAMALQSSCVGFRNGRCSYNPLKKCLQCEQSDALEVAADITALLFYYRCLDHLADEGFWKRLAVRCILPRAKHYHKKAKMRLPQVDVWFCEMMQQQQRLEQAKTASIDAAAEPFALLLQALCMTLSDDDKQKQVLSRFGYCLGRYVYLADAAADMVQDGKRGRYNPFIHNKRLNVCDKDAVEQCQQYAADVLRHCQAECIAAYNLLEIHRFDGVLRNTLQEGMTDVLAHLFECKNAVNTVRIHEYFNDVSAENPYHKI